MVVPGVLYWKLVSATYLGPGESSGDSTVYFTLLDESGNPVQGQRAYLASPESQIPVVTDTSGSAGRVMEGSYMPARGDVGSYSAWVDGLPSDRVTGLGRPHNQPVSFRLTWQRTKK